MPELREMLAANRADDLRDFCDVTPPEIAAEFLSALTPAEQRTTLQLLDAPVRAMVFRHFDEEVRRPLLDLLDEDEVAEILAKMPDEVRLEFLEGVPDDQRERLRLSLERSPSENAQPVLETLQDALTAEPTPVPEEMTAEEIAAEINPDLESYRCVAGRMERTNRIERGCWVNVTSPSKDNLPLIAEHFGIPVDFLTASLDLDETARVETENGATLFIVKVPYFDETNVDVLYVTIPIGIILTKGIVLTVCPKPGSVLNDFLQGKVRHASSGHRFVLQIIMRATLLYLQHLKQLNNAANIIQKKLERESRNKQLIKLFNIEKSLVYFTTSLRSNMLMLERLRRVRALELNEENENLLDDILTECKQAIEMSQIYSDILSGMMDAFASVISNNLNIVMRLLTSITIVMTIPVLVASFMGMNVPLPARLGESPWAFFGIAGLSVLLCTVTVVFFLRKRWLER